MSVPLLIGRFQPFHKGHLHAVKYILNRHNELLIGIGSAFESHTMRNPFTVGERIQMIKIGLKEANIPCNKYMIIPIPDTEIHYSWVSIVKMLSPPFDIVYSNDPLTRTLFTEAQVKVYPIPFLKRDIYSGEEFRRRVIENRNWREIVQESVASFLINNGLIERIIELSKSDKP